MAISALCIIHCLITPLLLVAVPALAPRSEAAEGVLVGLAALVALTSLRSSRRREGRIAERIAFGAALLLMVGSRTIGIDGTAEAIVGTAGSLALIAAHIINCRACRSAGCRAAGRGALVAAFAVAVFGSSEPLHAQEVNAVTVEARRYVGIPYRFGGASRRGLDI
jgi:hypothetical protein